MQQYSPHPSFPDFQQASLPTAEPITRLLAAESKPATVLPLLNRLESTSAISREKAVFYAYHLGHESAQVRHVCAERLGHELVHPQTALPLLCMALAREPERELRVQLREYIQGYGFTVPTDPGESWSRNSEKARKADMHYRLMDGAKPESVHSLLISIGLESSPLVHGEAFDVLRELFPKLSQLQREASVLTCLYLLKRSDSLEPGSLSGSFYYLESLRVQSPALCEVTKHYFDHPDTYVGASAACALMALKPGCSEMCADVLVEAILRPCRVSLGVPPTEELTVPSIHDQILHLATTVTAELRPLGLRLDEQIAKLFQQHLEEYDEAVDSVHQAYERSIRRLHRSFSVTERTLTQHGQCSAALMGLTRLEQFSQPDKNRIMGAVLALLEAGSSSLYIYRWILEALPRAEGFQRPCFERIAKLLFSDRSEDFELCACSALGKIGAANPELRDQSRLLLKLVVSGERSVYLKRHVEKILPLLDPP